MKATLLGRTTTKVVEDVKVDIQKHPDCFAEREDPFRACSCRCRTHSQLTRHENEYKTKFHFCHYDEPPARPMPEIRVGRQGESCNEVCATPRASSEAGTTDNKPTSALSHDESGDDGSGYVCDDIDLRVVNSCEMLRKYMGCELGCEGSVGGDQPCMVMAAASKRAKKCLFQSNAQYFSCSGKHTETARLCPCQRNFMI